jgi:hypothetical protein
MSNNNNTYIMQTHKKLLFWFVRLKTPKLLKEKDYEITDKYIIFKAAGRFEVVYNG